MFSPVKSSTTCIVICLASYSINEFIVIIPRPCLLKISYFITLTTHPVMKDTRRVNVVRPVP